MHRWYTIYPKEHYTKPEKTRSILLMNRCITTDSWLQIDLRSSDVTAIQLDTECSRLTLINMYNDSTTQQGLKCTIQGMRHREKNTETALDNCPIIWLGDFNLHHPMWDKNCNSHLFTKCNLESAQPLIDVMTEFDLQMTLPKDIPMLCALASGNYTRPNNVFISSSLAVNIQKCAVMLTDCPVRTDHFPIVTDINMGLDTQIDPPWPNSRATDWNMVREAMAVCLSELVPGSKPHNEAEFYANLHRLTTTITEAIKSSVPTTSLLPFQKCWWTRELLDRHKEACRIS